ncbi:hypothetical protein BS636_11995 [Acinetobacter sp. LoGeW2-3]|uniref:hypothetical protein n=1 Tax=Acinetobacter sp. LoGeW2-3 TaxID=1808001 RepID=UPI000C05C3C4|nr:hypothetical protein [Acinetobacter sp. LoGeW2-3]ATO20338.1 hypothetical protein BS636_11995 [Acinetobacter sp. LoGeW2-3]
MWLLIISIGLIFTSEFLIKASRPEIAKNDKQMRLIRSILLAITSPFLAVGLLSLRGDDISENIWFIAILTIALTGIVIKNALAFRKP